MGRPMISIYTVLDTVAHEMAWNPSLTPGEEKITYRQFKSILILSEITTNERKCRELWNMVRDLDLGRRVNQSDMLLIDMPTLCRILARKFSVYRERMSEVARV